MARANAAIKAGQIEVLLFKGQTHLTLGRAEEALACFDEVLKLDPNHAKALAQKGVALEQLMRRLEQRVHELEHTTQTHRPETEGTAAEAEPGTSAQPELAGAESLSAILLGKGQSLLNLDEQENAVACFNEILKLDPNHAEALVKKGVALEQLDRLEEAIACYDRALDANRSMTIAYLRKAGLCNRMARYSEALECYEQALRTQKGSHTA